MLDHVAFPHILDCVLQHSPPGLLLTFRRTSQDVCARVDRLLTRVTATMSATKDGKDRAVTLSARGWSARFPRPNMSALSNEQALRLVAADRAHLEPILARAEVIDIHGPLSYNLPTLPRGRREAGTPWGLRGAAGTLRLHPDREGRLAPPTALKAETLVVFGGAAKGGSPVNHVQLSGHEKRVIINIPIVFEKGVARWFSFDGHPDLLAPLSKGRRFPPQWAGEVVFVFHTAGANDVAERLARTHISDNGHGDDDASDASDNFSDDDDFSEESDFDNEGDFDGPDYDISEDSGWLSLCDTVSEMVQRADAELTFVGFPSRMRKGDGVVGADNLRMVVRDAIEAEGNFTDSEPSSLSHHAYADAVGVETYKLHTQPDGPWFWPYESAPAIQDHPRHVVRPLHEMFAQ